MEKNKKETMGIERHMKDGEIVKRLLRYAKPYWFRFVLALVIMLVSIVYDLVSPLLIGSITALVKDSYTNTALGEGDSVDSVTVTGSREPRRTRHTPGASCTARTASISVSSVPRP